jgi:hypothetical protein
VLQHQLDLSTGDEEAVVGANGKKVVIEQADTVVKENSQLQKEIDGLNQNLLNSHAELSAVELEEDKAKKVVDGLKKDCKKAESAIKSGFYVCHTLNVALGEYCDDSYTTSQARGRLNTIDEEKSNNTASKRGSSASRAKKKLEFTASGLKKSKSVHPTSEGIVKSDLQEKHARISTMLQEYEREITKGNFPTHKEGPWDEQAKKAADTEKNQVAAARKAHESNAKQLTMVLVLLCVAGIAALVLNHRVVHGDL